MMTTVEVGGVWVHNVIIHILHFYIIVLNRNCTYLVYGFLVPYIYVTLFLIRSVEYIFQITEYMVSEPLGFKTLEYSFDG